MFDWPQFLTQHNIPYITTGKVGRNDIGTQCPFCGQADTGNNMSISLVNRGWYCWRQSDGHRGLTPHRLIQALIGCSYLDAEAIVKNGTSFIPNDGDFIDQLKGLFDDSPKLSPAPLQPLLIPREFHPITDFGRGRMFVSYLEKRGFDYDDITNLVIKYDLRCCVSDTFMYGAYHNRLIFLITIDNKLVSWTGRHIGSSKLRYNSLSTEGKLPASMSLKNTILWYDILRQINAETLVVCEGPFDALKVNYLGNQRGIYATCVYGSTISDCQLDLLCSLTQYKVKYLVLDAEVMLSYGNNIDNSKIGPLEAAGFKTVILPKSIKDPGEFTKSSFSNVFGC